MANYTHTISIGLPVYNGENYLAQALDSLLSQTFSDFELVISDNASTDNTEKICRSYATRNPCIRYYRSKTNLGAAENYNRTFKLSNGKYFKWATHDDLCAPEMLEKCVKILDARPDIVLCFPQTSVIDAEGEFLKYQDDNLNLDAPSALDRFTKLVTRMRECNAVFGLIRTDVLKTTPLIGNYIASDVCLLIELCLHGKFYEIPERLFFRRDHPQASSSDKSIDKQLEFFDPALEDEIVVPQIRQYRETCLSVSRSPVGLREKVMIYTFLLKTLYWKRFYYHELRYAALKYLKNWSGLKADEKST